jgi:hypothetical protein
MALLAHQKKYKNYNKYILNKLSKRLRDKFDTGDRLDGNIMTLIKYMNNYSNKKEVLFNCIFETIYNVGDKTGHNVDDSLIDHIR